MASSAQHHQGDGPASSLGRVSTEQCVLVGDQLDHLVISRHVGMGGEKSNGPVVEVEAVALNLAAAVAADWW